MSYGVTQRGEGRDIEVKAFFTEGYKDLEAEINEFLLGEKQMEIKEIKYQMCKVGDTIYFSALVVFRVLVN